MVLLLHNYLSDTITTCNEISIRTTSSSTSPYLVVVPFAHINILQEAFSHTGPAVLWCINVDYRTLVSS